MMPAKHISAILTLMLSAIFLAAPAGARPVAMEPPPAGLAARQCLDCHRLPNLESNEGALANRALCQECHAQSQCQRQVDGSAVSLQVKEKDFQGSRHRFVACLQCHTDVARSPHKSSLGVQCLSCHPPHGEALIRNPHLGVRCEACHHQSKFVVLDKASGLVGLASKDSKGKPLSLASHTQPDLKADEFCLRCHQAGNQAGAPDMVLPAKGFICFLCHSASLSIGSWWFGLAFVIFLAGAVLTGLFYLKGSVAGQEESLHRKITEGSETIWRAVFSRRFWGIAGVLFFDVFLQRRILKESMRRWFFHGLIYLSIMAKMGLGLFTWLVYQGWPDSSLALALMDKNHGFVAFSNDLLGLFLLLGVVLAALQRWVFKPEHTLAEYKDNLALILLGLIALLGFQLEAARILVSQVPAAQAVYSFVSYPLSRLWANFNLDWAALYGWLWYAHGLLAALL
ncbi:MAG: hypothetical protein PVG03_13795, partial [Desulfarculaceae bacterium]